MRKRVSTPRLVVYALLVLLVPTTAVPQSTTGKSEVYEQLNLFGEAFERIRQDAVEPVGDKRLVETAISGMLAALDPNCVYLTEDEYKAQQAGPEAQTGSIGLVVTLDGSQLKVVSPRDGSPAAQAGLKPGEQIFEIDKKQVYDLTLSRIEAKLNGPIDSDVTLTLRGDNGKPLYVTMKRAVDKWASVSSSLEGGDVGYIRIAGFDDGTQAALTAAVQTLSQQAGNKLVGYVLDLRNDPGGNFDVALKVADDFLDKGDIAVIKGRKSDGGAKTIPATPGDITGALPIVVLVNGGTASEAELVAGALQDNRRAVLVGTKTFGESAIETLIPLDGNGAIRLTTARFLTPGGHAIQGKGLTPDVVVAPVKLERIAQGFGEREVDLPGALKNTDPVAPVPAAGNPPPPAPPISSAAPGPASPPEAAAAPPEKHDTRASVASGDLGGSQDEQLAQALDMLRGLAMVTARNGQ